MINLFKKLSDWIDKTLGCDTFTGEHGHYVREITDSGVEIKFISKGE